MHTTVQLVLRCADQRGYHLCGVDDVVAVLAEMMTLGEHLLFEPVDIVDARHGDDGEFAQVAVDNNRLCVSVTDHADAACPGKFVELVFELCTEI